LLLPAATPLQLLEAVLHAILKAQQKISVKFSAPLDKDMPMLHQGTTHTRGLTDALNYFCHFAINVNLQQECVAGQAGMEHFSHLVLRHNTMISGTISRLPWRH
jgi:hypothetical protein